MYSWDKRLAQEAMKWGWNPIDPFQYTIDEESDPWKVMSPEDRTQAYKLFRKSLQVMPASLKQKEIVKQLNGILLKYKLKPIPTERINEAFTMQNLYDLRLQLLALITDENVAKIRQQFQTKDKPPAASAKKDTKKES